MASLGFGAWGLGGDSYGPISFQNGVDLIKDSLSSGIRFFDTSPTYGAGQSELIIGEAISGFNEEKDLYICTKLGSLPHVGRDMPFIFDPIFLRQSLYASRFRLKREFLDIVYLHSPPINLDNQDIKSIRDVINKELELGKIKRFGVSLKSPSDFSYFLKLFPEISAFQFNFNLIDQRAKECGLLEYLSISKTLGIARTPFVFGFLATATKENLFGTNDHRKNWSSEQINQWIESKNIFDELANSLKLSITELALNFCLSTPEVTHVIPGMLSYSEISSNIKTSLKPKLSLNQLSDIYDIYRKYDFRPKILI